ncbi:hypothetical protein GQ457_01G056160 [Hibiscus cannabinus]
MFWSAVSLLSLSRKLPLPTPFFTGEAPIEPPSPSVSYTTATMVFPFSSRVNSPHHRPVPRRRLCVTVVKPFQLSPSALTFTWAAVVVVRWVVLCVLCCLCGLVGRRKWRGLWWCKGGRWWLSPPLLCSFRVVVGRSGSGAI